MKLLLQEGYNKEINIRAILTSDNYEILTYATQNKNPDMIKLLLEHLKKPQVNTNETHANENSYLVFRLAAANKDHE